MILGILLGFHILTLVVTLGGGALRIGLGGSFGGPSGSGQFSSQVSGFTPSNSGSYSVGQYGTNTSSMFGGS